MIITLKNIKHAEFSSEETNCYEATVYVDGKRSVIAKNDGRGGADYYRPIKGQTHGEMAFVIADINAELGKEKTKEYDLDNCLEFVCSDLLHQWLKDKDIKKILKRVVYARGNSIYEVNLQPTDVNIERVKTAKWWKPEYKMLNGLPIEDIRQYFK